MNDLYRKLNVLHDTPISRILDIIEIIHAFLVFRIDEDISCDELLRSCLIYIRRRWPEAVDDMIIDFGDKLRQDSIISCEDDTRVGEFVSHATLKTVDALATANNICLTELSMFPSASNASTIELLDECICGGTDHCKIVVDTFWLLREYMHISAKRLADDVVKCIVQEFGIST
jgi:hypothetical protein